MLRQRFFPDELKCAEVVPVYKKMIKRIRITKDLSVFCLIYQNYMKGVCINISNKYFEPLLSKFQCGFKQGFSAQNCLLEMVEKMKIKNRDNKGVFAAVLTDLSKAFDCIPHGLLIAKLNAFGFDKKSLSFISAYLYNREQKTKVGSEFSDFLSIFFGVPQGSI